MEKSLDRQPPSVIVLGYNRFRETTERCLASLAEDPDFGSWDVVLVDNGSDANNCDAFVQAQIRYQAVRLLRLEQNAGFPGGMNAGLRGVHGDPIFLVSSDVLIPSGTIGRLLAALDSHSRAGLISPVTNAAGNEQRILIELQQPESVALEQGRVFAEAGEGECVSAYRLDFCCVGLRRKVYETIGGFDETFSPGYYEDFDYSLMAREVGFELLVAENAFVYHEGGGTFGKVSAENQTLIARNKQRFLDKHGRNTLLPHVRDANLAVLGQYAEQAEGGSPPPALRIANRIRLAGTDVPRSFFKRWRFRRKVAALQKRLAAFYELPGSRG